MLVARLYQVFVPTLLVGAAAVASIGALNPQHRSSGSVQPFDAAYRDGVFVGRLHAKSGKVRLGTGRWNYAQDRRSYVAGYREGYQQVSGASLAAVPTGTVEQTAYRAGLAQGSGDRAACSSFQAAKLVRGLSSEPARAAYANGYQEGYYGSGAAVTGNCQLER